MRALLLAFLASSMAASPTLAQSVPGGPAAHRLMFTPTARAIPSGEWRLGATQVLIPNVSAGLGGGVSLGAGMVVGPEPVLSGITFIEPKVTVVNRRGIDVALGATAQINPTGEREASVFPYAVATLGAAEAPGTFAATLGLAARLNVRPIFDPSVAFDLATPGSDEIIRSPPNAHAVYAIPAPAVFAGTELRATERVTVLLEAAALPDQNVSRIGAIGFPGCPECDTIERLDLPLTRSKVAYDLTGGIAFRYATRRVAVDAGVGVIRDAHIGSSSISLPSPWLNLTFGLGS